MKLTQKKYIKNNKEKTLGTGSYGSVIKAKLKGSNIYRAIKIIPKSRVKNPSRLVSEITIMQKLVSNYS